MKVDFNKDILGFDGKVAGRLDSKRVANHLFSNTSTQNPIGMKILLEKIYKAEKAIEIDPEEVKLLGSAIIGSGLTTAYSSAILEQLK